MGHTWILDVLRDLQSYAALNNLKAIAASAAQTLEVAQAEIAIAQGNGPDPVQDPVSVQGKAD